MDPRESIKSNNIIYEEIDWEKLNSKFKNKTIKIKKRIRIKKEDGNSTLRSIEIE